MKEVVCSYYRYSKEAEERGKILDQISATLILIDSRFSKFNFLISSRFETFDTLYISKYKWLKWLFKIVFMDADIARIQLFPDGNEIVVYDKDYYDSLKKLGEIYGFKRIVKCWNGCEKYLYQKEG